MRIKAIILVLHVLAIARVAVAATPTDSCSLPQDLQRVVSTKYPGARLVTLRDLTEDDRSIFQKEHANDCPGLAKVDFYGDGKPTFALVLSVSTSATVNAELILAHKDAENWETVLIDKAESSIPVAWSQGPGEYKDVYGEKKIQATRPVIVFCQYNAWAIVFAWTRNRVDKVWLRD